MINFCLSKITLSSAFYYLCNAIISASYVLDIEFSIKIARSGLTKSLFLALRLDAKKVVIEILYFFAAIFYVWSFETYSNKIILTLESLFVVCGWVFYCQNYNKMTLVLLKTG